MWRLITLDKPSLTEASIITQVVAGCVICYEGDITLVVNSKPMTLGKHSIFIYPPYCKVEVEAVGSQFRCTICEVSYEFVLSAMKTISWSPRLQFLSKVPIITLSDDTLDILNDLIRLITLRSNDKDNQLSDLTLDCLQRALAYEVFQAYIEQVEIPDPQSSSRNSIVVSFQEALKSDSIRHRDVRHYAEQQGLTPRYFATAIRELTGYPPLYWISRAVIVEAQHLMLDATLSLKEVTFKMNFTSQTFFSRWYHQYAGETPSQFRKRNKIRAR